MSKIMVTGPFSTFMSPLPGGRYSFSEAHKNRITEVHNLLKGANYEVLSAHIVDGYGEAPWPDDFVTRDLTWSASCDIQLLLLPADVTSGGTFRSDGAMIELGFAYARSKSLVILADDLSSDKNSFFLRSFAKKSGAKCIVWRDGYQQELLSYLKTIASPSKGAQFRRREQRSDVENVITDLRRERDPHQVFAAGLPLTVLPGVLSPRLSHAPDALIKRWSIPANAHVLDLGCGCGIIGIAALRQGAQSLVSLDINRGAVENTALNLSQLNLCEKGEARHSDAYSSLKDGESFDVIIFAAPYWDRAASDDLEKAFFDKDYKFFNAAIAGAHRWLAPNGAMYVIFADQGNVGKALQIIDNSQMRVQQMHLDSPTSPNGHIRIIWELRRRK